MINFPSIGDIRLTPHSTFKDIDGIEKYTFILLNGQEYEKEKFPLLFEFLKSTTLIDRNHGKAEGLCYRIIADIQEGL